jgi:hypothetical protein
MGSFSDYSATRNSGDSLHYHNMKVGAGEGSPSRLVKSIDLECMLLSRHAMCSFIFLDFLILSLIPEHLPTVLHST